MSIRRQKGKGYRYIEDVRDLGYLVRDHRPEAVTNVVRKSVNHPMFRFPLDQGQTGTCTAHSWATWAWAGPVIQRLKLAGLNPFDVYRKEVLIDEWPDNNGEATLPDNQLLMGSSVRAGAQVMRSLGWLTTFGWVKTAQEVIDYIISTGPVQVGTPWYPDWDPDGKTVLVIPKGAPAPDEGHAYSFTGWDQKRGLLRSPNSWGRGHEILMAPETLDTLLGMGSEACVSMEVRSTT